jgi:hypothetical protein
MLASAEDEQTEECNATASPNNELASATGYPDADPDYSLSDDSYSDTSDNHNIQNPDKFSLSGVYKLTCSDCKKVYIGQTVRDFLTRYNEHKRSFGNNSHTSKLAPYLI